MRYKSDFVRALLELHVWGRAPEGMWWALVSWHDRPYRPGYGYVPRWYTGWMDQHHVHPIDPYEQRSMAVRLHLPEDRSAWPRWWCLHGAVDLGVITGPVSVPSELCADGTSRPITGRPG